MKNRTLTFALGLFFAFSITSCTVTQEYHFNRDLSGSTTTVMDMSMLMDFMSSMDTTDVGSSMDTLDQSFDEVREQLLELGAENVKVGWRGEGNKILEMSYDFKDIETLNKILASQDPATGLASDNPGDGPKAKFTNRGNRTLQYHAPDMKESEMLNNEEMESMSDYYTFETIFSFDRTIKSVNTDTYTLSPDKKKLQTKVTLSEMLQEGYSQDFEVKLKLFN